MYRITKDILAKIDQTAAMLPIVLGWTKEKHRMTGAEVIELGTIKEIEGKKIIEDMTYIIPFPVQLNYNHKRRLRKAYQKGGFDAIQKYVLMIHQITQENQN